MKRPVSFTLEAENLLWLKGQAGARNRTVSAVVDELVTQARRARRRDAAGIRSVVGTIDLAGDDPGLSNADAYIRAVFARSTRRPLVVREAASSYRLKPRRRQRG